MKQLQSSSQNSPDLTPDRQQITMLRLGSILLAGASTVQGAALVASTFAGGIYTLSLTEGSSPKISIAGQTNGCGSTPGWLDYQSDDKQLYCFDESWSGKGQMAQWSVDSSGKLTLVGTAQTSGNDVHGTLYGGSNGKSFIASAQYSPSTITTYKAPLKGTSRAQQEKFTLSQKGPNSRQDVPHPHEVKVDPSGKYILVPDLGADMIRIFKIDQSSGRLTSCGQAKTGAGDGPRHIKFWKSDAGVQIAYTVNELGNSVSSWAVSDSGSCLSLSKLQTLSTFAAGKKGSSMTKAAEIQIAGSWLYAANRADKAFGNEQDSIAIYKIDSSTGQLSWQEAANSYSFYPRTFVFNKAGTLAAIGGQTSANVAIVERDPATGKLGKLLSTVQVGNKGRAGEEDGLSAVVWIE